VVVGRQGGGDCEGALSSNEEDGWRSWGCDGRCGVRRGCSSTQQQHAADGVSGRAQWHNSGTKMHPVFDSSWGDSAALQRVT
jgi:hypothetical protein